ncbi:hypothetical protein M9Y10_034121 [Tritrichomonas musculus]|uniref:Protein kinase domain-containing protein n=1 Tax=Tritrichomonas musculus TaxID=1915356 RepID=A0ABR2KE36_9EUKA
MIENKYDFFLNESNKYEKILQDYKNDNSKVFTDENFHPNYRIVEPELENEKPPIELYPSDNSVTWERIDEYYKAPLFKDSKIHPLFVNQGALGSCYFISALSRVAKQSDLVQTLFKKKLPDKILGKVQDSINIECGAVVVYFRVFGRRTPVLIDTRVPFKNGQPFFSRPITKDKSPWFCLVEKAFAKLNGSYSNIHGGQFAYSIYSLFGYYYKNFHLTNNFNYNNLKILKYQMNGCLMDTSIIAGKGHVQKAEKKGLLDLHSYLLVKVRKYKDMIFYQIRNPWGRKVWNGDYSIKSELWTPELKEVLREKPRRGLFWMLDKDYYTYFTDVQVSKPINPHWIMKMFEFRPKPSPSDSYKIDIQQQFICQLKDEIPDGKKARFRILVEKRNSQYKNSNNVIILFYGINGGKKYVKYDSNSGMKYISNKHFLSCTLPIKNKNEIVTFTIVFIAPPDVDCDCYVNVFCEYDFDLYDIDKPAVKFSRGETRGAAFDNFSINAPNSALVLKKTIINGREEYWLTNPTISDYEAMNNKLKVQDLVENLIYQQPVTHYCFQGPQLNLMKYIFKNELFNCGKTSEIYSVTEKETGEERAAIISRLSIDIISKEFSEKVAIMRQLKYPSIINYIGFCENDFKEQPNPLIMTDFYPKGNLDSFLGNTPNDLNNTKKMIILIGVAFGMKYIHEHNIILRDLKCSSILLDDNLYPKISHFNSARIAGVNNSDYFEFDGQVNIAPELFDKSKNYSFPVDVFAYGMLLYHVICNNEPSIDYESLWDLYDEFLKGKIYPPLDCIPAKYHEFINKMWCLDDKLRPSFDEIINKLIDERNIYWLDDVDEKEVESYIHQFGYTLKSKDQAEYINAINKINNDCYQKMTYQQILDDLLIISDEIKIADDLIDRNENLEQNKELFYRVGNELMKKVHHNFLNCVKYFKVSALSGHKNAVFDLAKVLCYKSPDEASLKIGVELANIASDFNFIDAFNLLGKLYNEGKGVMKNNAISAIYFKMAADQGNPYSMFEYASILMHFAKKDLEINESNSLIKEAKKLVAESDGKSSYFYNEARLTFQTIENKEASLFIAKKYYEKAAQNGIVEANDKLKNINENFGNIDCPPPYFEELCQEFLVNVVDENPEAMLNYAIFLLADGYLEIYYNEIFNLFKRSADLGNVSASLCYSIINKKGYLHVSVNEQEADKYFKLAEEAKATEREIESAFNLGGMIFRGEVQPFKSQDAVFFIEKAAKGGNGSAMFYYSLLLYDGEFCDRDESESIHMLRSSILKSSPESAEAYTYIVNKFGTEFYNNDNDSIYREALEYSTTRTIIKTSNFLDRGESLRLLKKVCSKNYSAGIEAYSSVRGIFHKLFYEMEKVRHENNIDENFHVASIIVLSLNDESNKKRIIKHMKKIGVNTVEGVYGEIKDAYEMIYQKELNNDNIHIKLKEMLSESDF